MGSHLHCPAAWSRDVFDIMSWMFCKNLLRSKMSLLSGSLSWFQYDKSFIQIHLKQLDTNKEKSVCVVCIPVLFCLVVLDLLEADQTCFTLWDLVNLICLLAIFNVWDFLGYIQYRTSV